MSVEIRPSCAKPEKVIYVAHWGFAKRIFLLIIDLASSATSHHFQNMPEALRVGGMTHSVFTADIVRDIPCAVVTSTGVTFLACQDR